MRVALTPEGACRLRKGACFLAWFLLAAPAALRADRPAPADLTSKVEEYMAARALRDHYSGTILVAKNGQVLFCRGYGMANREHEVPCTAKTKFRLGSLTKQFTAMAILILQERGKLAVSDKVKKHAPNAPKAWDEITIHHLLTHTSGIPNYTEFPDFLKTLRTPVSLAELIAKFKNKPLDFKAGEKFKYSNSGYIVLGQIIETASGRSYASFLKETIFDPLQMHDSGYDNTAAILRHRASGYATILGLAPSNALYIDMSIPHAAGALFSTVEDLLKWDRALDSERLVSKKSIDAMFTPFKNGYGYGWTIGRKFDQPFFAHQGGIPGFVTIIERYPAEKLLVVALSNLENARVGTIGNDLAAIALGEPYVVPREPKAVAVDLKLYDAYAGQYEEDQGDRKEKTLITVAKEGNTLLIQSKGQRRLLAVPESETRFYVKGADATLEFVKGPKGVDLMILQDNQHKKARRIDPSPAVPAGKGQPAARKPSSQPARQPERAPSPGPGTKP